MVVVKYLIVYSQTCLKRPLKGPKKCGNLTQVNYSEKCAFRGLKERSLNTGGLKDRFDCIMTTSRNLLLSTLSFTLTHQTNITRHNTLIQALISILISNMHAVETQEIMKTVLCICNFHQQLHKKVTE